MSVRHIELFSGIGGFRQAMDACERDSGIAFECKGYSEIECNALRAYRAMFDTRGEVDMGDISAFVSSSERIKTLPAVDLVTGGFPCQSFSMMGKQGGLSDPRGNLFFSILEVIKQCEPRFVLLENVKNLKTHDSGRTFKVILSSLEELGYRVFSDVFNSAQFGLAQTRNRIYIFATRDVVPDGFEFSCRAVKARFEELHTVTLSSQKSVKDVLFPQVDAKYFLSPKILKTVLADGSANFRAKSEINLPIARPLCATMAKMHRACQDNYYSQDFIDGSVQLNLPESKTNVRRLTPHEALRLQGCTERTIEKILSSGLSDCALYKVAGNAVSVNVVYAILSYLSKAFSWEKL